MSSDGATKPTRDDVIARVRHDFPDEDPEVVLAILDRYGLKGFQRERNRVHLAILTLSEKNLRHLIHYTKAAEEDYRDVLLWASDNPPPTQTEDEDEARTFVRELLRRLGSDPDNTPKWRPIHLACPVCGEREPVAQVIWCDDQPMKERFPEIPIRTRGEPYLPANRARPLREIAMSLLCRNSHRWRLTAHLTDSGVDWEIVV